MAVNISNFDDGWKEINRRVNILQGEKMEGSVTVHTENERFYGSVSDRTRVLRMSTDFKHVSGDMDVTTYSSTKMGEWEHLSALYTHPVYAQRGMRLALRNTQLEGISAATLKKIAVILPGMIYGKQPPDEIAIYESMLGKGEMLYQAIQNGHIIQRFSLSRVAFEKICRVLEGIIPLPKKEVEGQVGLGGGPSLGADYVSLSRPS